MPLRVRERIKKNAGFVAFDIEWTFIRFSFMTRYETNAILYGLVAGAAGVVAMTLAEKVEQQFTERPNSYVPGRTLKALLRKQVIDEETPLGHNWAIRWGQGHIARSRPRPHGRTRAARADGLLFSLEPAFAEGSTLENATGVGAPLWTWPVDEQIIDLIHKGIYAFTTGAVVDAFVLGPGGIPEPRQPWARTLKQVLYSAPRASSTFRGGC